MAAAPRRGADRAALRSRSPQEPKPERRAPVLTPDQLAQMLAIATPRDAALLALMAAGACRIGETLLLCWQDIDHAGRVTVPGHITKAGRSRAFTIPPQALAYIQRWRQECPASQAGWIFPGQPIRCPLSTRQGQRIITKLAAAVGVKTSSHTLRRSALTIASRQGLGLQALALLGGHSNLASLQRYLDQDTHQEQAEAARALLFEAVGA